VQHVKIYIPCNFEVNPITHFDRLCKLEKRGDEIKKKSPFLYWSYLPFYIGVISLFYIGVISLFYIGVTSLFYIVRLHCNLLIWSCLPLIFCAIALQSIKLRVTSLFYIGVISLFILELSPFFILELPPFFILCDCIAIY
jgi:hypothetical protein